MCFHHHNRLLVFWRPVKECRHQPFHGDRRFLHFPILEGRRARQWFRGPGLWPHCPPSALRWLKPPGRPFLCQQVFFPVPWWNIKFYSFFRTPLILENGTILCSSLFK